MADQPVTREKLINADKDVQVIEDFIKKPKDETVTTRFGDEIMTLKGLEEEVKKSGGYFKRYATLAAANADIANIPVNSVVKVTDAVDGGDYEKATAGATSLTKSQYDPISIVNENRLFRPSATSVSNYDLNDYTTGGIHIFNNAPLDPDVSKNFPAYGMGNSGTLFVMAVKPGDISEVVRQVYVSRDSMYFRSRYQGEFEAWQKIAKDSDLKTVSDELSTNALINPNVRVAENCDLNSFTKAQIVIFSNAPLSSETSLNFPAYGSGNSGSLFVMAENSDTGGGVIRQVYTASNGMYYRTTFNGQFLEWQKLANDADLQEVKSSSLVSPKTYEDLDYDLNNFRKAGIYNFRYSASDAQVSKNFPVYAAGTLFVMADNVGAENNLVRQIYISRTQLFYRATYQGVFEPWKSAVDEAQVSDIVNLNSIVKPIIFDYTTNIDLNTFTKVGMYVFNVAAPIGSETSLNFPAYGSGNAGVLFVLGGHSSSTTTIVRQIFITSNAMYFRATFGGVFSKWKSTSSLDGIPTSEKAASQAKNWVYRDGNYLKQDRGEYPDYYTKPNSEVVSSVADWYARYDALMDAHPDSVTKTRFGESVNGLDMFAYTISPPPKRLTGSWTDKKPPKILIQAFIHGSEHIGSISLLGFLDNLLNNLRTEDGYAVLRNTFEFVVVPIVNPDGVTESKRTNANDVDLNRDWIAQTQQEIVYLRDFYLQHLDAIHFIDMHAHGEQQLFWIGTNDNYEFAEAYSNELVADVLKRFLPTKDPSLDYSWITPSISAGTTVNFFTNNNVNSMLIENLNGTGHRFADGTRLTMRKIGIYSLYKAIECILKAHNNSNLKLVK